MNQKKYDANELWEVSWTHIRSVIDTVREPFLILDKDLRVLASNSCFLRTFQVSEKETEGMLVYDLGNGQWNIPRLKTLLEDIAKHNLFFKDLEVDYEFPQIGRKIILLNARQIFKDTSNKEDVLILLAMEDVTDRRLVAEKLAAYSEKIEAQLGSKMNDLATQVRELAKLNKTLESRDLELIEFKKEILELKNEILELKDRLLK